MYDIKNLKIWKESPLDNPLLNKQYVMEIEASGVEVLMKKEGYNNIREILEGTGLININETPKGRGFRFPIYLSSRMEEEDIESLELSVRSKNCLKRAGLNTIGDLCKKVHSSGDLRVIRNCGNTSVAEIMDKLFLYNYQQLKPEQRGNYIAKVVEMNIATKNV